MLKQALDNLVENAFEHGFDNKPTPGEFLSIGVFLNSNVPEIQIDVTNSGKGVSSDFDLKEVMGLKKDKGLPLVNTIIKEHGGRLWYTPEDGNEGIFGDRGVTFEIYLPVEFE